MFIQHLGTSVLYQRYAEKGSVVLPSELSLIEEQHCRTLEFLAFRNTLCPPLILCPRTLMDHTNRLPFSLASGWVQAKGVLAGGERAGGA